MLKNSTEKLIDNVLKKNLLKGELTLTYPSGQAVVYGSGTPTAAVRVNNLSLLRLRNPAMFLGEAYMHKDVEIAEEDLVPFFQIMSQNPSQSSALDILQKIPKRQRNKKSKQRKQIQHHYDVGNDYYKLWLDKTLTYSCAYYHDPKDSLEQAQRQKIQHLLKKLRLQKGHTLLDIGCGWGHLSVAAAKQYGVKVIGITLSEEQLKGAKALAKREGVEHLVTFELKNYQDVSDDMRFDRIISVGMFEHVGRHNHAKYFEKIRRILADDGVSVLHTITDRMDRPVSPWIDKYIFPGGYLPTVDGIEALLAAQGFWSIDREDLWQHYAMTLDEWRKRHQQHRKEIITMFDEVFYRQQDFWLAGSSAAFSFGDNGLNQFIFTKKKPAFRSWPLTREYIY